MERPKIRQSTAELRIPFVHILFSVCSPSAIVWFIVTVVVYPVECFTFRSMSHIAKKVLKTIPPSVTYFYPTTTPIFVSFIIRVIASIFHHSPGVVNSRFRHEMGGTTAITTRITNISAFHRTISSFTNFVLLDIKSIFTYLTLHTSPTHKTFVLTRCGAIGITSRKSILWHINTFTANATQYSFTFPQFKSISFIPTILGAILTLSMFRVRRKNEVLFPTVIAMLAYTFLHSSKYNIIGGIAQ